MRAEEQEVFGVFDERTKRLDELAQQYHMETESYDRTVCTGPIINESIIPDNGFELRLINRNARAVRKRLLVYAERLGFTTQEWNSAISHNSPSRR